MNNIISETIEGNYKVTKYSNGAVVKEYYVKEEIPPQQVVEAPSFEEKILLNQEYIMALLELQGGMF